MRKIFPRLKLNEKSIFAGIQINRSKPIKFTLNQIEINGFEGDSILSATIANGIIGAGKHKGFEIALDETLSLPVCQFSENPKPKDYLPIELMPAINGGDFISKGYKKTSGFAKILKKLNSKKTNSLELNFDAYFAISTPWHGAEIDENLSVDLLIIGAGIAGLSAASNAANSKHKTLLIDQRAYCGGDAMLFGHSSNEENPKSIISRLKSELEKAKNIEIKTSCKAITIEKNIVKILSIETDGIKTKSKITLIKAKKIIIATGCSDRLPLFSGNRLKGTIGLSSAFHLAYGYGVWQSDISTGKTAITTTNNTAYRFATLAQDAGAKIHKLFDSRVEINSRFAQFARAYGIKSETSLKPNHLHIDKKSNKLILQMGLTFGGDESHSQPLEIDNIILAGGWVPQLFLWHQAGGIIAPLEGSFALSASGKIKNIELAGSCANWTSTSAVCQSATNAFNILYRRKTNKIVEKRIDAIFETPAGLNPINVDILAHFAPIYYDRLSSFACQTDEISNNIFQKIRPLSKDSTNSYFTDDKALSLADLSSKYILKQMPYTDFTEISNERVIVPNTIYYEEIKETNKAANNKKPPITPPNYIEGNFGSGATLWNVFSSQNILFEIGNLIYANSDIKDPIKAIGVIVGQVNQNNIALIDKDFSEPNKLIFISGLQGHTKATILNEFKNNK